MVFSVQDYLTIYIFNGLWNPQGIYIFIHGENFPASHEKPLVTFHYYTDWLIGVLLMVC